ncbi:unnamed protein product [Mytilus edulis]|uniref:Mutator-like transposase domain-containing protein n=1 Tax=Mytilus edulis TaxID=6550 RepID=A0A8S3QEF4_MYTED|nr:unnamed protein product [Mytilus edulis]
MQVSSASSKSEFTNSTTNVLPKKPTESLWLPRLTEKDFKLYSKESYDKKSYVAPQTEKCATTVKLLRPHKVSDDYLDEYLGDTNTENRTVDRDLNILMMNNLIICHINESPHCNVPHFELVQETQWGLGWIWELKCTKCKFISEKYKMFREIETGRPGRKSASINYGFQTGVINSNIDYCTIDGDAKSVKGLQEAMQEVFGPLWSVNRLADTIHRGQSQFREGIRANFSVGMFPGVTKAQKNDIKTAFVNDIKLRSHGIMRSLFMKYNGDRQQISKCLPGIVRYVVNCYSGNCGDTCRWSITLCNGGKKTSWWYKSINLNSHGLQNGSLIPTDRDKLLIESLLEMKLSQSALDQMKFFSNTNKCESVNRTISTYLPKIRISPAMP